MQKRYKGLLLSIVFLFILTLIVGCSSQEKIAVQKKSESKKASASSESVENRLPNLTIQAPMGISNAAPLYKILEENTLKNVVEEVIFLPWKTPDELRSRIISKQVQVSAVPTNVAANLYNKGMDVKLINTLVWGVLYVVGPEGEALTWEDLKGETIHVPFKGDMPDLVFQYLMKKSNIDILKDVHIEYISTPQEVVQLMAAGKAKYAVLPEHSASLAIAKSKKEGKNLQKIMNLQEEWAAATGKQPRIPQAGIIVSGDLIESHPEVIEELQKQIESSIQFLNDQPAEGSQLIAKYQEGLEPAFIEKLIPSLNLQFVSAQDSKEELELFFTELSTISPDLIGGKLPDEAFYYQQ